MIDPNTVTTARVGQLPPSGFGLTDNIPHEIGTELFRGTVKQLGDTIGDYLGVVSGSAYNNTVVIDGGNLPDTTTKEWLFVGKGTFHNTAGQPDIITTEELNILSSNGTYWSLAVAIPIDVEFAGITQNIRSGYTETTPSENTLFNEFLKYIKTENFNTNNLTNDSDVEGVTVTDALNNLEALIPENYSKIVYVDNNDPNSATIFSLENPPVVNDDLLKNDIANLYIGLDASTWVYNGLNYVTKVVTSETSNFFLSGTTTDALGNKTAPISRSGSIQAPAFIKTGGTQDEYQMANGSSKKIDLDRIINLSPHALAANFLENKNIEKAISLNTRRNIFVNSETYTNGNNVVVGTGMSIDNTDTFLYNGIKLARFKGTAYTSNITLRQAILTAGKRYILSFYVKNNNSFYTENRFIWFNTNNSSSSGHGARFVDNNVRRVAYMFQAAGATGVYINGSTLEPIGTGATGFLTMAVTKTFAAPYTDLYIGGIQIEEVPDTYIDGVVWMGDSTIQANSDANNYILSSAIPRFFEAIYNCTSYNVAVAGERLDQMDARWATSVTTRKPNSKYVVIQGGVNDIAQGRSLADMQASVNSMNTKAIADGFIPVFLTCTPNSANTVLQNTQRVDFNNWLKTNFKKVIDINTIVEQESKIMVATPNSLFENDGIHYGVSIRKAIAEFIAKSGFFEFLQPSDYQATTASYTGKDLSAKSATVADLTFSTVPATSAGGYNIATFNSTTNKVEKVPSTTFAPTASPALAGVPTAPTAPSGTNTTQLATTAFVQDAVSGASSDIQDIVDAATKTATIDAGNSQISVLDGTTDNRNFSVIINNGFAQTSTLTLNNSYAQLIGEYDGDIAAFRTELGKATITQNISGGTASLRIDPDLTHGSYHFSVAKTYNDATTSAKTGTELDTDYPIARPGDKVHALSITGGGKIYEKSAAGWVEYNVTNVAP